MSNSEHDNGIVIQDMLVRRLLGKNSVAESIDKQNMSGTLKADKNATLDDFIEMVSKIVTKVLNLKNVDFRPDEGAIINDPSKPLERPCILYKVISRKPKNELKPRFNADIIETYDTLTGNKRIGHNYSQRQNCIVQFDVVAADYKTANDVMSIFEDAILTYTGYFKKNGVAELIFHQYFTDENLNQYRQTMSVRSIQYLLEIEKLITIFDTTIDDIGVQFTN